MSEKEEILSKIEMKEKQEYMASGEAEAWNKGKYKNSSNAQLSKLLLKSLQQEIALLYEELNKLK